MDGNRIVCHRWENAFLLEIPSIKIFPEGELLLVNIITFMAFHFVPELPDEKTCEIVSLDILDVIEGIKPPISYEQIDLYYIYSTLRCNKALEFIDRKPKASNTLLWTMLNSFAMEYKAYPQLPQEDLSDIEEWVIEYLKKSI